MTTEQITDEQCQQLMDGIVNLCEEMALEPQQILDGIARSLLGATAALGTSKLSVSIENFGSCEVVINSEE